MGAPTARRNRKRQTGQRRRNGERCRASADPDSQRRRPARTGGRQQHQQATPTRAFGRPPERASATAHERRQCRRRTAHDETAGTAAPPAKAARKPPATYAARAHAATAGRAAGTPAATRAGGATGTETPHTPPANRRTASGNPTQPAQAAANAAAAASDENPTTTTTPENERDDARSRQRHAPAHSADPTSRRHHGADSGATSEPRETTSAREPTTENEATAHTHTPPGRPAEDRSDAPHSAPATAWRPAQRGDADGGKAEAGAGMRPTAKRGQDSPRRLAPGQRRATPQQRCGRAGRHHRPLGSVRALGRFG